MDWLISNYAAVGLAILSVVGGASIAAKLIAPLTKTKVDDKLANVLSFIHSMLTKIGLK